MPRHSSFRRCLSAAGFLAALAVVWPNPDAVAQNTASQNTASQDTASRDITIATGGISGVYYPVGGAICRLVNRNPSNDHTRCNVDITSGSVANLRLLMGGFNEFAIVQSDILAKLPGLENRDEARERLRAVVRLHPEIATIVVRADSDIEELSDLKRRTVSAGDLSSGHFATFEMLEETAGWPLDERSILLEVSPADQAKLLCDETIDAFFNMVGHPNSSVAEANDLCGVRILKLDPFLVTKLENRSPDLSMVELPGDLYGGFVFANGVSLATFAILATTVNVDADSVSLVTRSVRGGFEDMQEMNGAFLPLSVTSLYANRLAVPVHPAAASVFTSGGD